MATDKEILDIVEEEDDGAIETLEYTDEKGKDHCFVVEEKFNVGSDVFVAMFEIDPAVFFAEDGEEHGHPHQHGEGAEPCGCGHDHHHGPEEEFDPDNVIIAKMVETEDGSVDIDVPTDEEFAKAKAVYEKLAGGEDAD